MMQRYWVILRKELFSLFISPATYVSTFYFLALLGLGFRFFIESFSGTNWILPPLSSLALGLLFGAPALIPFLTMRSIAEERRLGTLETLMSAPVIAGFAHPILFRNGKAKAIPPPLIISLRFKCQLFIFMFVLFSRIPKYFTCTQSNDHVEQSVPIDGTLLQ